MDDGTRQNAWICAAVGHSQGQDFENALDSQNDPFDLAHDMAVIKGAGCPAAITLAEPLSPWGQAALAARRSSKLMAMNSGM